MIGRSMAARAAWIGCQLLFPVILGCVAWTARAADLPGEKVLFEENFADASGKDWTWLREIPNHWKIDKERKELLISPVWSEGNMKNIPLWTVPDVKTGSLAIEVHIEHEPTGDYEYAGLIWYIDDKNYVAIRNGPHGEDGKVMWVMRCKVGKVESPSKVTYNAQSVDLRMVITGAKAEGLYRPSSADEWHSMGEVEMPNGDPAKVGFRTGNGDGPKPSWAHFSKFRILQLDR
jgi:beta-xylosidase